MSPMVIRIGRGAGRGPTRLAAFDGALRDAGVANFNLVRLSSVIPPASQVVVADTPLAPDGCWGDRLYVVAAEWGTDEPGTEAWAGIGWVQDPDGGHGLFVEHEGPTADRVRSDIAASLAALCRGRGEVGERMGPVQMVVHGLRCVDDPVCALVIASYQADPWRR